MFKEFRDFAMQGNVMDLAVGVIIGGAFGKIVTSLVTDIIMPTFGLILGNIDFTSLALGPVKYGNFLQSIIDFLIVAFAIFFTVKQINRFRKKAPPPPPAEAPQDIKLLTEIRDLLKKEERPSR